MEPGVVYDRPIETITHSQCMARYAPPKPMEKDPWEPGPMTSPMGKDWFNPVLQPAPQPTREDEYMELLSLEKEKRAEARRRQERAELRKPNQRGFTIGIPRATMDRHQGIAKRAGRGVVKKW